MCKNLNRQFLDFYVPSVIPSMTRRQGRKCKQLLCKFKKTRKYWNLTNVVDHTLPGELASEETMDLS